MATLHFQQIADSRFGENEESLNSKIKGVLENLGKLPGVHVDVGKPGSLSFDGNSTAQYRADFWVTKNRQTTWEQVYRAVNAICAVPYRFL